MAQHWTDCYTSFEYGDEVILDSNFNNSTKVTVIRQTPNRIYTTVTSDGENAWDVMTNRLSVIENENE